jgi:hypothetical protein
MQTETLQLERLVDDPEIRRAAAKTLKGFCLTYLPHHLPADLSDFFDEMARALEDYNLKRLEIIGFRGSAKSTMASLALVLWAALEHPDKYPFIIMLADTRGQASINTASVRIEHVGDLARLFVVNSFEGIEAVLRGIKYPCAYNIRYFVVYEKTATLGQLDCF